MNTNINAFDTMMTDAVKAFWHSRRKAATSQQKRGVADQGNRSSVTAGKNMDGFADMVRQIIVDNGISDAHVYTEGRNDLTIPGFYRPTKNWDLLVVSRNRLLAAVELKSQVGPSFGNNFNNRVEEALGNAVDLNTAYREGVFEQSPKPFVGYFFVLEDCARSRDSVRISSPHFSAFPEFENTGYAQRYEILCRKLVQEQLYDAAALVVTPRRAETTGAFQSMSQISSARRFAATLAGKMSAMALEGM